MPIYLNPIPTGHGRNQPIYERHVTTAGRAKFLKLADEFLVMPEGKIREAPFF